MTNHQLSSDVNTYEVATQERGPADENHSVTENEYCLGRRVYCG
jgi:hypothetical protein